MLNRPNPLSIEVLGQLDYDKLDGDFGKIQQTIQLDDQARAEWKAKCNEIRKLIDGEDKRTHLPWPWASQLSVPLLKKLLRQWKPGMYNLFAAAEPLAMFKAGTGVAAERTTVCEDFFTWLVKDHMDDVGSQYQYLLDNVGGDRGTGYMVASWDYRTELETRIVIGEALFPNGVPQDLNVVVNTLVQQYGLQGSDSTMVEQLNVAAQKLASGTPYAKITYRRVVKDKPRVQAVDPMRVIVPPDSGQPHEAEYVAIAFDYSADELRQFARDGIFNKEAVDDVIEKEKSPGAQGTPTSPLTSISDDLDYVKTQQQQDAGVFAQGTFSRKIRVFLVYCWLDTNQDGQNERCVLWFAEKTKTRLALHEFPFSFRYWPVFRYDYEKTDPRPHLSRGIGQILCDIQKELNHLHRGMMDSVDIELSPTFQMRITAGLDPREIKFGAGLIIPVQQVGDIGPVSQNTSNIPAYMQTKAELMTFADDTVGSVNSALAATGRNLERRTAFEVQQVAGQIEAIQTMDAASFQSVNKLLWQCIWQMWLDLGPTEIFFQVTGEEAPRPFIKMEEDQHFQLMPSATPGNINRDAMLQKALLVFDKFAVLPPGTLNMPLLVWWILTLIDRRMAQRLVLTEDESAAEQVVNRAAKTIAEGELPPETMALMAGARTRGGPPNGGGAAPAP